MAMSMEFSKMLLSVMAFVMLLAHGVYGEVTCMDLPRDMCSFSVSKSGKRCALERHITGLHVGYRCIETSIKAWGFADWIETDECVNACGVSRDWVGISSDPLLNFLFVEKLCSPACQGRCPNLVDLYHRLASAEGISLSNLCTDIKSLPRREMITEAGFAAATSGSEAAPSFSAPPSPN